MLSAERPAKIIGHIEGYLMESTNESSWMAPHIIWGEPLEERDVLPISVAPSARYSLLVNFTLPSGGKGNHVVVGTWDYILEMLENGEALWDTVSVVDLRIKKLSE